MRILHLAKKHALLVRAVASLLGCVALSGCAGPLVTGGTVYFSRAFVLQPVNDPSKKCLEGIPIKEARLYRVHAYVVEGLCPAATEGPQDFPLPPKAGDCQVRSVDLGVVPLQAPDRTLEFRYRGGLFAPASVSLDLNDNSTLRSLAVVEEPYGPSLFFYFGRLGTGVR